MTSHLRVAAVAALTLALGACSGGDPDGGTADSTSSAATSSAPETSAVPADQPFGAGCSAVPADGEGSFTGMADDPVATAASHNPALTSLVGAVTAAGLVDSLNSQQDVTVLAPANPAFEAVPEDARTALLTHHVIAGRLTPDHLAGTHTTLNNDEVTIEGSGATFTIAGDETLTETAASVICGKVQTANPTVYIIDQVLAPPA